MTPDSADDMRSACHALAAQVLMSRAVSNRCKWLRDQVADLLKNPEHIEYYAKQYQREYPYADVRNPYLADTLKEWDSMDQG